MCVCLFCPQLHEEERARHTADMRIQDLLAQCESLKLDIETARQEATLAAQRSDISAVKQVIDGKVRPELQSLSRQSLDWAELLRGLQSRVSQQDDMLAQYKLHMDEQMRQMRQAARDSVDRIARLGPTAGSQKQADEMRTLQLRAEELTAKNTKMVEYVTTLETKIVDLGRQLRGASQAASAAQAADVSARSKALLERFVGDTMSRRKNSAAGSVHGSDEGDAQSVRSAV